MVSHPDGHCDKACSCGSSHQGTYNQKMSTDLGNSFAEEVEGHLEMTLSPSEPLRRST